jgi:hypothetical protein
MCSIEVKNLMGIYFAVSQLLGSVLMHGGDFVFIITGCWETFDFSPLVFSVMESVYYSVF